MVPTHNGSLRLFRLFGIGVYLHWSWLIVAVIAVQMQSRYTNPVWSLLELTSLFGIVLLHEFGHALACRSVGGQADEILLWPLGGIAYVNPPPRPGPVLWSIAAGPLVNVGLIPVTLLLALLTYDYTLTPEQLDLQGNTAKFFVTLFAINLGLLVFNLLPVYPLDGGQILQAILWFAIGRRLSLQIVSILGLVLGGLALVLSLAFQQFWFALISGFILLRSWAGMQQVKILEQLEEAERHAGPACPTCHAEPLVGDYWMCDECDEVFDMFARRGVCPHCGHEHTEVMCPECRRSHPRDAWYQEAQEVEEIELPARK